jgi:hypothetical protein
VPSVVSAPPAVGAHVSVFGAAGVSVDAALPGASGVVVQVPAVSAAAVESPVVAVAVSVAPGVVAHVAAASPAAPGSPVVAVGVSAASGALAHVAAVSPVAADPPVVVVAVSVASGAVALVSDVSTAGGLSVVVLASGVSTAGGLSVVVLASGVSSDGAVEGGALESGDVVAVLGVGGGGSSALAGVVSRDAQTTDVSTATPHPRTSRAGRLSKRGRGLPQTAPEPPSIRPSSRWVALSFGACGAVSYCSRVLHLTLATQECECTLHTTCHGRDHSRPSRRHLHQPQVEPEKGTASTFLAMSAYCEGGTAAVPAAPAPHVANGEGQGAA